MWVTGFGHLGLKGFDWGPISGQVETLDSGFGNSRLWFSVLFVWSCFLCCDSPLRSTTHVRMIRLSSLLGACVLCLQPCCVGANAT